MVLPRIHGEPTIEDFAGMTAATPVAREMVRIDQFTQRAPDDGQPVTERTDVYVGYDATNLYVVFVAFDRQPERIRARLEPREGITLDEDQVGFYLDTFHDRRRAYGFGCNALGIQSDVIYSEDSGELDDSLIQSGRRTEHERTKAISWR
jgi:hypothetical protein